MEVALREPLFQKPVFPAHHVCGLDVAEAHLAEERKDVLVDNGILGELGADSQPRIYVTGVHSLNESLDGDLDALVARREEVALPSHSLLLGDEPALRFLVALSHGVAVPSLDRPGPALLVAANRH